jgi:hypothetical protein
VDPWFNYGGSVCEHVDAGHISDAEVCGGKIRPSDIELFWGNKGIAGLAATFSWTKKRTPGVHWCVALPERGRRVMARNLRIGSQSVAADAVTRSRRPPRL